MSNILTLAELAKQFKGVDKGFNVKKIINDNSNIIEIESLEPFASLEYVSFRDNSINSIDFLIRNYYLRHINLSNNKILILDERIMHLSRLEYINIANNNLNDISPLNSCIKLKVIVANNNKITTFPKISKLQDLEVLILSDNLIETIDLSTHNKKLIKVSLSRNKIREFPITKSWPSLIELRLNGNKIITIPPKEQLDVMSSIKTLDLGNNSIYDKTYVLNLRSFVNLRNLNLLGNIVSDKIKVEELQLGRLIIYNSKKIVKRDVDEYKDEVIKSHKKNRNILCVRLDGVDSKEFLQGITTNNVTKLSQIGTNVTKLANVISNPAISSLFLTPQGKIIADCIIVGIDSGYIIDIGDKSYDDLVNLINKRKLSSKVSITPITCNMYQLLPPFIATTIDQNDEKSIIDNLDFSSQFADVCYLDPRHWRLGLRILSQLNVEKIESIGYNLEDYNYYKILLRYLEMVENVGYGYGRRLVPQDINMDNELYISRTKGCYTGQEIVNKLRNRLLFPRYKLIANVDNDYKIQGLDLDQIIRDSDITSHINRDVLLALVSFIHNNSQAPQQYSMKLFHRV